jgi:aryl-alcohol dehydrogenase-like predicted oxidoreductase
VGARHRAGPFCYEWEMSDLPTTTFGRTGLTVTKLGYGAMELRGAGGGGMAREVDESTVGPLLNAVLDGGINLIDTSPDYGRSEELIGEHLSKRRDEFTLTSKCGCAVSTDGTPTGFGQHTFTRENVRAGVEQSLRRMRTDHLDAVQFHASPEWSTLVDNESVAELEALRDEGKIRFIGMSGTLPNIEGHISAGVFDVFQIPYSAIERDHEETISAAAATGAGIIIRGGVARGIPAARPESLERLPERFREVFTERRDRFDRANLDDLLGDMSRMEFMLRFTISHPDMHTTIVGTANPRHLQANLEAAAKGPLPADVYATAKERLAAAG